MGVKFRLYTVALSPTLDIGAVCGYVREYFNPTPSPLALISRGENCQYLNILGISAESHLAPPN